MSRTFKRIIITGIVLIAVALGAVAIVMTSWNSIGATGPVESFKNGVANTLIDITGVKGRIDSEMREKAGTLAAEIGVSQSAVDDIIDSLAIEDWRATTLPSGIEKTDTSTVKAKNLTATVTTYDDPSYVTVDMYGLSITMQAPESAQAFTPYIHYLEDLE